jgi:hypothetical protein
LFCLKKIYLEEGKFIGFSLKFTLLNEINWKREVGGGAAGDQTLQSSSLLLFIIKANGVLGLGVKLTSNKLNFDFIQVIF